MKNVVASQALVKACLLRGKKRAVFISGLSEFLIVSQALLEVLNDKCRSYYTQAFF